MTTRRHSPALPALLFALVALPLTLTRIGTSAALRPVIESTVGTIGFKCAFVLLVACLVAFASGRKDAVSV